jgi:hypothetical protein
MPGIFSKQRPHPFPQEVTDMKRTSKWWQLLIGIWLVALLASCASTATRESTGEYIDDAAITTKVKAAIFNDPTLKVFQIEVGTYKGDVQLSGFVDSSQTAAHADKVAAAVNGVRSVKDDLIVKKDVHE